MSFLIGVIPKPRQARKLSDNGMKLKFWLWSVSEEEVRSKATKDGIADITKIIQKDPPFL